MTPDYQEIKQLLFDKCLQTVNMRISAARSAMENAQKAANEEGKSSAGDKYETTRAMMQIQRDNAAKQMDEADNLKQMLLQISLKSAKDKVQAGSLVVTPKFSYFIAISIGAIQFFENEYFVISPMSPIAQKLLGKKRGESFLFNKEELIILDII